MITDQQRDQLFTRAEAVFGPEEAAIFMEAIGMTQWANVATKQDIAPVKLDVSELKVDVSALKVDVSALKVDVSELKVDVSELKQDVSVLKVDVSELKVAVSALRQDLRATEERLESRLDRRLAESTRDIQRTFVTWLFASQASLAAIVAIIVAAS